MRGAALLALLLAAPAAAQDCPTAADLAAGIRVAFADGSEEVHRASGPGLVRAEGRRPDGTGWVLDLAQGIFVLARQEVPPDPAFALSLDYGRPPDTLPRPEPLGRVAVAATVSDSSGERMEVQEHRYGPLRPVEIGGCAYEALEARLAYGQPLTYEEGVLWLPSLGIGLLAWSAPAGGLRSDNPPVAIARAP